ncbi:MAG TPA: type II secretion system F family protein, partial [Firmicutes bacterium]|nr:type II secretion system F family protein [Bacillota bacterium]
MPEYAYIAVNETGREVRGRIEAGRPEEVREKLRRSGLYPVNIVEGKADAAASPGLFAGRRHWKRADLVQVTMQLSHLLEAGMPVDKALEVLARHNRKPAVRTVLRQMLEEVRAGQGLADVIAKRQELFPRLYIHMVRAGEIGGRLEEILANLARYLESEARRWSQVRSMLIYPVFVMAMAVLAMVIVLTVIMPQIEQVFADFEQALPVPTLVLVGMSRRLARHWPLLLAGAVLPVFALRLALRRPAWRLRWDQAKLRLPLIGDIMQKLVAARVTRTLGVMLQGGVPMLDALTIAAGAGGNTWVANCVE